MKIWPSCVPSYPSFGKNVGWHVGIVVTFRVWQHVMLRRSAPRDAPTGKISTLLPRKRVVGADTMSYVHSLFSACAAAIGGWCDTCAVV